MSLKGFCYLAYCIVQDLVERETGTRPERLTLDMIKKHGAKAVEMAR